jgi:hypothetical protein
MKTDQGKRKGTGPTEERGWAVRGQKANFGPETARSEGGEINWLSIYLID